MSKTTPDSSQLWRIPLGHLVTILTSGEAFAQLAAQVAEVPITKSWSVWLWDKIEDEERESEEDEHAEIVENRLLDTLRYLLEGSGLLAALALSPQEATAALAEIHAAIRQLTFLEADQLSQEWREIYTSLTRWGHNTLLETAEMMELVLGCYVNRAYDPQQNPNELIRQAVELTTVYFEYDDESELLHPDAEALAQARQWIAQAGAIVLHGDSGKPLWRRWSKEVFGAIREPLVTTIFLLKDYTRAGVAPLGAPETAHARLPELVASYQDILEPHPRLPDFMLSPPQDTISPQVRVTIGQMIEELIELEDQPYPPELLSLCQAHRAEAIPALIALATDEYYQWTDAPGGGYAPIRAVELLGKLQATEAIPALIDVIAGSAYDAIIYDTAIRALEQIGPPVVDPVLDFIRYSRDIQTKIAVADVILETATAPDDTIFAILAQLWEEADWEDGKCLLAYPLTQFNAEKAIPLLQAALEDPEMNEMLDYNEVAIALNGLGIETPPPDRMRYHVFESQDWREMVEWLAVSLDEPKHIREFLKAAPPQWQEHPYELAGVYAMIETRRMIMRLVHTLVVSPPEVSESILEILISGAEALQFDPITPFSEDPDWLITAYTHIVEEIGLQLKNRLIGICLPVLYFLQKQYEIADAPDQLLWEAREQPVGSEEQRELFARAGALALHGQPLWHRWVYETDPPLSYWIAGFMELHQALKSIGQIPLQPQSMTSDEAIPLLRDKLYPKGEEREIPKNIQPLIDTILECNDDYMPPEKRRPFIHRRAAIIPYLIDLLDETYWYEGSPGDGWAAILAAQMLGELKAHQAADALIHAVAENDTDDILYHAALFGLMHIGKPALPAVKNYFLYGRNTTTKAFLAEVLGIIGRRDRSVFPILQSAWESTDWTQHRRMIALGFGGLGDRRAVPLLRAALNDPEADVVDVDYVRAALMELGEIVSPTKRRTSSKPRTPPPFDVRIVVDEDGFPRRIKYTSWREPICPHCGNPFIRGEDGVWEHPQESEGTGRRPRRSKRTKKQRKKRRKKRRK